VLTARHREHHHRHVSSCGCNIEDSRLAMLGDEFTFIMLLSGSWNAITLIESTLPLKGAELDLLIVMKRTTARPAQAMPTPSGFRLRCRTRRISLSVLLRCLTAGR
jgi:glycine cleavage system regulatory protein